MSTLLNNFREKTSRAGLVRLPPAVRSRPPPLSRHGFAQEILLPLTHTRGLARLVASRPGGATLRYRAMTADPRTFSSPNLTRSDASSPPVSTQSGWCHQVGSHLAAHEPVQAPRHLQCDWRYHDHSHGRARHQARELHRLHPGSRREGEFTTRNPDRSLGAPDCRASPQTEKINLEPLTPRISRRAPARLVTHPRLLPPSFNRRCPTSTPWTARTLSPSRSTSTTSSATGSASRCVARPVTALSDAFDGDGSAVAGCFESFARPERPAAPNSRRCRSPSVECLEGLFESAHVPLFAPRLTSTVSIGPRR